MAKLETVDRIREAISAGRLTTMQRDPRPGAPGWEVYSVSQDTDLNRKSHSLHVTEAEAYAAWQALERQRITRAVIETLREPDMYMLHAGLDRLGGAAIAPLSGCALEEVWTAMVDHLLTDLPEV